MLVAAAWLAVFAAPLLVFGEAPAPDGASPAGFWVGIANCGSRSAANGGATATWSTSWSPVRCSGDGLTGVSLSAPCSVSVSTAWHRRACRCSVRVPSPWCGPRRGGSAAYSTTGSAPSRSSCVLGRHGAVGIALIACRARRRSGSAVCCCACSSARLSRRRATCCCKCSAEGKEGVAFGLLHHDGTSCAHVGAVAVLHVHRHVRIEPGRPGRFVHGAGGRVGGDVVGAGARPPQLAAESAIHGAADGQPLPAWCCIGTPSMLIEQEMGGPMLTMLRLAERADAAASCTSLLHGSMTLNSVCKTLPLSM